MAFGTPVAGTVAYSAAGGTSVAPSYPASIVATDQLVMIIGQKPSAANGGTVTTPTGWTLREELTAAGGYGTTLGADTGNTNLRMYTKDTVTAGLSGTVTVTVATNNVCWAFIIRVPTAGGTISYGSADGQRTTTPTSPMSVALTDGTSATAFQAGDIAIWAMCIPTDVTTPSQFSAESITATGATFNTATEFNEPDSTTGNDIGGYSAWATVASGSSSTAPTVTATLAGTLTNVRGPVTLLRIRETLPTRTGTMAVTETGSDTFAGAGDVPIDGTMSASETGADSFAASGTVSDPAITGTMAATETGSDTFSGAGDVIVKGAMAATESGADTLSGAGDVIVQGAMAASESGSDTFAAFGDVVVQGAMAASESGSDTFAGTGTAAGAGITGTMAATETGADTLAATGTVKVQGQMTAVESGQDIAGQYVEDGYVQSGYYLQPWLGNVLVQGQMSATEAGEDTFHAEGGEAPVPPLPVFDAGDGADPRKRKPREFRLEDATALRETIAKIIDPVKGEAPAEAAVVKAKKTVTVVTATRALAVPVPPKVDADAIAKEVSAILERAGIAARQAESVKIAQEAMSVAHENMRLRMKRRREEELLLLL